MSRADPIRVVAPGVHRILLDANGIQLSALFSTPALNLPRATIVALHGAGMSSAYFHGLAHPDVSLLTTATRMGYAVLALDRPGYGASADLLPDGQSLAEQVDTVRAALASFTARNDIGAGLFLLGHSFGGKLALTLAGDAPEFGGVEVSGCGHRFAPLAPGAKVWKRNWGDLQLYPPGTFTQIGSAVDTPPPLELADTLTWPDTFAEVAARIRIPVQLSFAAQERWWRTDAAALGELPALFESAPRTSVARVPHAGHNISLGWAARAYHAGVLAFFETCLLDRAAA
ncbi:alpha/beta hydrolase [Nocardia sp. NBC_01327]|uniref:alpha/beta hydrolase n=1 Tax=Nocardia sp. NBC_01327 TaxID=2903593 RepID=UPI002E1499F1|nr:lysophospholipase [Nocardia sp. NBC_01327]